MKNLEITVKDIVEIIANGYSIETIRFVIDNSTDGILLGVCMDDGKKREILLNEDINIEDRREAIIHEFLHAKSFVYGKKYSEREVKTNAKRIYNAIYNKNR